MKAKPAFLALFTIILCALMFAQARFDFLNLRAAEKPARGTPPQVLLDTNRLPSETMGVTSFAPVVKRVAPSVVTIYSSKTVQRTTQMSPFDDPMLRRFFGIPEDEEVLPPGRGGRRGPQRRQQTGVGSGVIVSADGYILSNNHVVEGADELKVQMNGGPEEYVAKVIGTDPATDISVLKIDAQNLPPVTMTDSDNLQVGDIVLAVGNPFGVGQTVTMGIVSATGRAMGGVVSYEDFIQTDAAINVGNSGGALVDAAGRLVGINTAIISPTGGSIGLGFAVPVNMARYVMDSIITAGKVTRGYLGIQLAPEISASLAQAFNLKGRSGALVDDVVAGSPAAKAGVKPGDIITQLNGRKVPDSRQLRLWVSQTAPQTKIGMTVVRDGKEQKVTATLGELKPEMLAGRFGPGSGRAVPQQKSDALDGVEVTDLDRGTRQQLGVPANVEGALVTAVDPDSTAAEAGLGRNDVIVSINRKPVRNAQEAIELSEQLPEDKVILLRIWTPSRTGDGSGNMRFLPVEPSKPGAGREEQ